MVSEKDEASKNPAVEPPVDSAAMAEKIKTLAQEGSFREAESLRDKLLACDPMALSHIVATAEVIEQEKTKQLDTDHVAVWDALYSNLSEEEINCIFFSLEKAQVASGKLLLAQGKRNSRLFFIDSGRVSLFFRKDAKNTPLVQLGRGDVIGDDTFFGISLCTFSAVTQSKVGLRHLSRKDIGLWHDNHPGLYDKLADFCRKNGKSETVASQKNLERRKYFRYPAKAVVTAYIVDSQGRKTATYFRGAVLDISRSGICFSIKCSKQENARPLLAKNLELSIVFDDKEDKVFRKFGAIVKVSYFLLNDYNVHVRFSEIIEESAFKTFPCDFEDDVSNK